MSKKILIIGSPNYSNRRILAELRKLGHSADITPVDDYVLAISDKRGHDKVYYKDKRIYAKTISAIIPRIGAGLSLGASLVRQMNLNMDVYSTSSSEGLLSASDKYKCSQILSKSRIPVPKCILFRKASNYKHLTNLVGGLPCVAKLLKGSQGKGVFILTDELGGSTALKTISMQQKVLLQQFIETAEKDEKKCDIRAWVVGKKVVAAMKRFSVDADFRSNYSISKDAAPVELTKEEERIAIEAAAAINLKCCGVDLVRDVNTKKSYVIECNGNASLLGIEKVTEINVAFEIAKLIGKNSKDVPKKSEHKDEFKIKNNYKGISHLEFPIVPPDTIDDDEFVFDDPENAFTREEVIEANFNLIPSSESPSIYKAFEIGSMEIIARRDGKTLDQVMNEFRSKKIKQRAKNWSR